MAFAAVLATAKAAEISPDAPSISASLGAWFQDAANTFDPATGIWADSSGKERHAVPVGEVNVNGPVTYLAPTLSTISGGAFTSEEVASVRFASDAEDLLAAPDINGGTNLNSLTIFLVVNANPLGSNASLMRPAGIGSVAALQFNAGDNFNLGSDPSIRKDNGQLGSGTYSRAFPYGTTFIRTARMSPTAIDEWFNIDGTAQKVVNLPGVSYTTSSDDFYLGDLRAGVSPIPGVAGGGTSRAQFDIVQAIVYGAALTDAQVIGVNEWLAANLAGKTDEAFIRLTIAPATSGFALEWDSEPGMLYNLRSSTDPGADLASWALVEGDLAATPPTNRKDVNPSEATLFYRVEAFPAPPVTVFEENFDGIAAGNLPDGWTTGAGPSDSGTTAWQLGNPAGGAATGPPTASSPDHCVGTNIDSDHGFFTDIWVRTPPIDLATVDEATLSFKQFRDIENVPGIDLDFGTIRILAADGFAELAVLESAVEGADSNWVNYEKAIPAADISEPIVIEFGFQSDDIDNFAGWYLDDVAVTVPTS